MHTNHLYAQKSRVFLGFKILERTPGSIHVAQVLFGCSSIYGAPIGQGQQEDGTCRLIYT